MFLSLNIQWILKLVHFESLDQFNHLSFEIHGYNPFNHILLCLFNISYTFQDLIWVIYIV